MASGVALFLNARGALPPASTELCSSAAGPFKSCIQIGEEPKMNNRAEQYIALIEAFLARGISAQEFESTYFEYFKGEPRLLDESLFAILNELFMWVEAFTLDDRLLASHPDTFVDEATLRERAQEAVKHLAEWRRKGMPEERS
jgi:hypothetical protein